MLNTSTKHAQLLNSLALILAYVITGKLGLMLALPPGYASAIFPPAGIAIAAVLMTGSAALPAVFIGSLLLNLLVGYSDHQQVNLLTIKVATLIALASTLQAYLGGWWLTRRIGYPTTLDSPANVVAFFISAPIICLVSATISVSGLFMLGLIGKPLFLSSWASWWVGDALGLIVMLPLSLVAAGHPRNVWKKRLATVALPMMITFVLLVITFVNVSRWERKESLAEFETISNQLSNQIRLSFTSQETVLKQIGSLFLYREHNAISRKDFHLFVQPIISDYPMIYAIEWAPLVPHEKRNAFVQQQRKDGFVDFDIKQLDANKHMMKAQEQQSYYPITYIEPLEDETNAIIGFDLASTTVHQQSIQKAILQKKMLVAPPTELIVNDGKELSLNLIYPVKTQLQDGVLVAKLRAEHFFNALLNPVKHEIYARLVDTETGQLLHSTNIKSSPNTLFIHTFQFGDRRLQVETTPTALYYQQHRGWQSWGLLAVGIFGTGLMGALLLMGTGYTARIENLVKQKTDDLQESFKHFEEITASLEEGIYVIDTKGIITFANPKAQQLLGRDESELIGENAHLLFHHKHIDDSVYLENDCQIRNVLHTKLPYKSEEEMFWHKNGTLIHSSVSAVPLFRNNDVVGIVVAFDDISKRKATEQALRASEKSFREIIQFAPIGIAIVSLEGGFITVNQTLCNIVGYSNNELIKLTFQEITHYEDLSADLAFVQQLLDGEKNTYQMEKRYVRKNQEIIWIQLSVSLFRNEENIPQYFIAQIEDINERKARDNIVHQHAYFDTLTKLPNRRMLLDRLAQTLSLAERHQRTMALLFLDLDHFKRVNDSLGHDAGDIVLKESAARLLSCVRIHDTVSRQGGDEFVIILTEISNVQDAKIVAEKIIKKIQEPIRINGQTIEIGTSVGIAARIGNMQITPKQLMKHADIAMYEAKAAGRNQYFVYEDIS